jgi:hypothetical protein
MPLFKKNKSSDGSWVEVPAGTPTALDPTGKNKKPKKVFKVITVRGRQEQAWLDSNLWQPLQETVVPAEAKGPAKVVYYGTYSSDGMRQDGAPGGSYSAVFDQYKMEGADLYTRDEARHVNQWDTRKPFPGFDPKLGSKTLDIYSED